MGILYKSPGMCIHIIVKLGSITLFNIEVYIFTAKAGQTPVELTECLLDFLMVSGVKSTFIFRLQ